MSECVICFHGWMLVLGGSGHSYRPNVLLIDSHSQSVCVCVCQPLCLRVPPRFLFLECFFSRGTEHSLANSVQRSYAWKHGLITRVYLQKLLYKLSNPPFLIPWWFMILPTNHFPSATFSCHAFRELQTSEQFVKHFSCADLFTLRFPHLPSRLGD